MKQKVYFKMFGGTRASAEEEIWRSVTDIPDSGVGKKQQAFLIYLILNRKDVILSADLKEKFWPSERKDPANSLKNMIHKTRGLLSTIVPEIPDERQR